VRAFIGGVSACFDLIGAADEFIGVLKEVKVRRESGVEGLMVELGESDFFQM
jgi:hypothetical protein